MFVFFEQQTAYGVRIGDWSSDVCSSDLPPAGGGALLGRRTDQRGLRVFLVEIFADRGDFRENAAVVELERGRLSGGVHIDIIGRTPVLTAAQVDADLGNIDTLFGRSEERRVGQECVRPCRSRWSPYH